MTLFTLNPSAHKAHAIRISALFFSDTTWSAMLSFRSFAFSIICRNYSTILSSGSSSGENHMSVTVTPCCENCHVS